MGGKSKSSSSSQTGSGQAWAQPIAQNAAGQVQSVYNQAAPGLQQLTNLTQNSFIPSLNNKFQSSLQGANDANAYWRNLMGGGAENPYLAELLKSSNSRIFDDISGQFAASGRYGSGAWAGTAADRMSQNSNNILYQDYYNQAQRQDQAAQALQQGNVTDAGTLLGALGVGAELPYTGSNSLANSLGALFSGGTEKTKSKQGGGLLSGLLGAGAQIGSAAILASDRRLKRNIEKVGEYANGLNKYRWVYTFDPSNEVCEGVMADEVKTRFPKAYLEDARGYGMVDYSQLDLKEAA